MKFTELHIAVVTFRPLEFILLFLILVYAFRGLHGKGGRNTVRGENMTDRKTERENTRTGRDEEVWDQREREREGESERDSDRRRRRKKKYGGKEGKRRRIEKRDGKRRIKWTQERDAGAWAGIGAVRDFEEGNISIDVRFIDLPRRLATRNGQRARVTCHFAKWSHASRGYLAVRPVAVCVAPVNAPLHAYLILTRISFQW